LAVYGPASNYQLKEIFWKDILHQVEEIQVETVMVAGDLNQDIRDYRNTKSYNELKSITTTDAPADGITFNNGKWKSHIDGFLYSRELQSQVNRYKIEQPNPLSEDHAPVTIELKWTKKSPTEIRTKLKHQMDLQAKRKLPSSFLQEPKEMEKKFKNMNKNLENMKTSMETILRELKKLHMVTKIFGLEKETAQEKISELWEKYQKLLDTAIDQEVGWTFITPTKKINSQWTEEMNEQHSLTTTLKRARLAHDTKSAAYQQLQELPEEIYEKCLDSQQRLDRRKIRKVYNEEHNKLRSMLKQANKKAYRAKIKSTGKHAHPGPIKVLPQSQAYVQ